MQKSAAAFRTISEVAALLGVGAHVLRFWEQKFPQVAPRKGPGGRRYYRPEDVALLAGLHKLLHEDGLTTRGARRRLAEGGLAAVREAGQAWLDTHAAPPAAPAPQDPRESDGADSATNAGHAATPQAEGNTAQSGSPHEAAAGSAGPAAAGDGAEPDEAEARIGQPLEATEPAQGAWGGGPEDRAAARQSADRDLFGNPASTDERVMAKLRRRAAAQANPADERSPASAVTPLATGDDPGTESAPDLAARITSALARCDELALRGPLPDSLTRPLADLAQDLRALASRK